MLGPVSSQIAHYEKHTCDSLRELRKMLGVVSGSEAMSLWRWKTVGGGVCIDGE